MSLLIGSLVGVAIIATINGLERRSIRKGNERRHAAEVAEHNRQSRLEWQARQQRLNSDYWTL